MDSLKLTRILESHRNWLSGNKGRRADLSYANLSSADLSSANLRAANLRAADLSSAYLRSFESITNLAFVLCAYFRAYNLR